MCLHLHFTLFGVIPLVCKQSERDAFDTDEYPINVFPDSISTFEFLSKHPFPVDSNKHTLQLYSLSLSVY